MKRLTPSVDDMTQALKICATETPQKEYPCEGCYLYPLSRDGRMSAGRTCFEHLALDVVGALEAKEAVNRAYAVTIDLKNAEIWEIDKNARLTARLKQLEAELAGHREAEQDGRLVVLPHNPGDSLYDPITEVMSCEKYVADDCTIGRLGFERINSGGKFEDFVPLEDIGKTVFLTREEAEAALAGKGETDER